MIKTIWRITMTIRLTLQFIIKNLLFLIFVSISFSAYSQELRLKFSHVVAPDTPKGIAAKYFADSIKKNSNGTIIVDVFPNSQLFKDREEIEALQIGNVDFIAPSVSKFGPVGINDFEVFDLPYLFDDISELNLIVKGDIGQMLLRKLEEKNIHGLGYWFNGFKNFTANKDISNVKNFRGLKMRIQSSKVIESYMRHLKTFPQVLPFSETYTALQQGVVNGTENSLSNLYTQKMHEVQSHLLMSNHGALLYSVLMNKKKWQSLTNRQKELINSSFLSSLEYQRSIVDKFENEALNEIKKSKRVKIIELTKDEKSNFSSFLKKSYKKNYKRIDKDLIMTIENELSKTKN